jgi:hypothetical protein
MAVENEREHMRTRWLASLIALLMGCLVGGYSFIRPVDPMSTPLSATAGVVISAAALALPATISVLVDPMLSRRGPVVAGVAVTSLLLGGLMIGGAAFPAVWQGYSSDAAGNSVLAAMLLTPFVVAFVVSPLGARPDDNAWESQAIVYGVLAWAGIGLQSTLLTYVIPLFRIFIPVILFHQALPRDSGGLAYGWVFDLIFVFALIALYVVGFGYAVLLGLAGGALRRRLARPRRNTAEPLPRNVDH